MTFSKASIDRGIVLLKQYGYYELFQHLQIPNEWKEMKQVPCADIFDIKTTRQIIYDGEEMISDYNEDHCIYNLMYDPIIDSEINTCANWTKYLYELIVMIQKAN
jgi:hypothetical protein